MYKKESEEDARTAMALLLKTCRATILVFHTSILLKWTVCINSYFIYVYNDSGLGLIASFGFMQKFKFEVLI